MSDPAAVREALGGISGVHVTPYRKDGSIDLLGVSAAVGRIASAGVHIVVSGGNTGEFFSQTKSEVTAVQEAALEGRGDAVMVAGVGRSVIEAIETARNAERLGYDAVMVHQPADPFAGSPGVSGYIRRICDSVGLPVILYVRSPSLGAKDLLSLATLDQVVGIKFARGDPAELARLHRSSEGKVEWVCGLAEQWALPFYAVGARGFTSGLVNVAPAHSLSIHAALECGDFAKARRLIASIAVFEELRTRDDHGANVTVVKEALEILGHDVGSVREPGTPKLSEPDRQRLLATIEHWRHTGVLSEEHK